MRRQIFAICSALLVAAGMSVYSLVYAQTRHMAIHEPHMSAAFGHLEQAKAELEKATLTKGGHREKALQMVDQAMQQIQQGEQYDEHH
jgi:hypothetical protein